MELRSPLKIQFKMNCTLVRTKLKRYQNLLSRYGITVSHMTIGIYTLENTEGAIKKMDNPEKLATLDK